MIDLLFNTTNVFMFGEKKAYHLRGGYKNIYHINRFFNTDMKKIDNQPKLYKIEIDIDEKRIQNKSDLRLLDQILQIPCNDTKIDHKLLSLIPISKLQYDFYCLLENENNPKSFYIIKNFISDIYAIKQEESIDNPANISNFIKILYQSDDSTSIEEQIKNSNKFDFLSVKSLKFLYKIYRRHQLDFLLTNELQKRGIL